MEAAHLAIENLSVNPDPALVGAIGQTLLPLVGQSQWLRTIRPRLERLAEGSGIVGLVGEIGTGKTLLARHLHWGSSRVAGPCLVMNLRGVPPELVESELFGYVQGGFIARREVIPGALIRAGKGTCIIQGLERFSPALQSRCVEAITAQRVVPVGTEAVVPHEARTVIEVRAREYSPRRHEPNLIPLRGFSAEAILEVEPLTKRRDDVVPLVEFYLQHYAEAWGVSLPVLSGEVERALRRASWPENVRSLLKTAGGMLHEAKGDTVRLQHLPPALIGRPHVAAELGLEATALETLVTEKLRRFFSRLGAYEVQDLYDAVIEKVERPLIRLVLEQTDGNQVRAARMLGVNRNTLRSRMRTLGVARRRRK